MHLSTVYVVKTRISQPRSSSFGHLLFKVRLSPNSLQLKRMLCANYRPAELHDYMGEERGRALGMPVNEFVDKAYAGLVSGSDHVIIGSVGPEDLFLDIAHKRRQAFDSLANIMLQHYEL